MGDPKPFVRRALMNADMSKSHASDDVTDISAFGRVMVTGFNRRISAQCTWSGSTGDGSGVIALEWSIDGKQWLSNNRRTLMVEMTPSGDGEIAVFDLSMENWRITYEPNGVTSGSLNVTVFSS